MFTQPVRRTSATAPKRNSNDCLTSPTTDSLSGTGTEDALVFTTGYQANLGTIGTLLGPTDTVICDSGDHASILDGVAMSHAKVRPFRHNRLDKLETMLERAEGDGGGVLVVVDGVFSMEGDVCDVPTVASLARAHGARVMVDEAHGVGVLGARGAGACEALGVESDVDLRMGTFSKSLASCGGFIAGSHEVIDYLRIQSRAFLFTAAAVPAAVGAALAAVRICRSEEGPALFAKVLDNARYLHQGLRQLGFRVVKPTSLADWCLHQQNLFRGLGLHPGCRMLDRIITLHAVPIS